MCAFYYVKIKIIICKNCTTNRCCAYGPFPYPEFVNALGNKTVHYTVPASGTEPEGHIFKTFRPFEHLDHVLL
ncbi:hypothetical protein BMS3Bbin07_00454 [bacterium BMS3Bbin07]|nr:hypothetical protein BMS3Bbin07_00454 [bacterium BMS3Bbin07]